MRPSRFIVDMEVEVEFVPTIAVRGDVDETCDMDYLLALQVHDRSDKPSGIEMVRQMRLVLLVTV